MKLIQSPSKMQCLPAEVLRMILSWLTAVDTYEVRCALARLRLVSKWLNDTVTPYYFHTIPLWMSMKSLENLTAVSEHSQMCADLAEASEYH